MNKRTSNTKKTVARPSKNEVEKKKKLAYTLFVENGFDQKVIADITGISEQSISKWKIAGNWDDDREENKMGFDSQRKRLRSMINRTLQVIEERKYPTNVPDSKESDILNKLADAAKKLQTEISFAHKAETGKMFVQFIQQVYGQDKAVEILELWHEFIMQTN